MNILRAFQLLTPLEPILLLSHMRANTSLFGHILGTHPEINGYHEYSDKKTNDGRVPFIG